MEPLPSKEDVLQSQLSETQSTINEKNSEIKKERQKRIQQSERLTLLKKENDELQKQLLLLDDVLAYNQALVVNQKRKIARLEKIEKTLPILKTEITRVKNFDR